MQIKDKQNIRHLKDCNAMPICPDKQISWPLIYKAYHSMFYEINGEAWIIKNKGEEYSLNELLGETISKYFDLPTVANKLIYQDDSSIGVMSQVFYKDGYTYFHIDSFPAVEIRYYHHNLDNLDNSHFDHLYDAMEDEYFNLSEENMMAIQNSLKRMVIRDYFSDQQDRNIENFMFSFHQDKVSLAPLYDHEYSFGDYPYGSSFFNLKLYDPRVRQIIKNDDYLKQLITKGMALNAQQFIEQVEDEHQIILELTERERVAKTLTRQKHKINSYRQDLGI